MITSLVQKPVTINDARADPQIYDNCGFTLGVCEGDITDWDDEAQLEAYKKEVSIHSACNVRRALSLRSSRCTNSNASSA